MTNLKRKPKKAEAKKKDEPMFIEVEKCSSDSTPNEKDEPTFLEVEKCFGDSTPNNTQYDQGAGTHINIPKLNFSGSSRFWRN